MRPTHASRHIGPWLLLVLAGCTWWEGSTIYTPPPAPSPPGASTEPAKGAVAPSAPKGDIRVMPVQPGMPGTGPDNVAVIVERLGTEERTMAAGALAFRYADDQAAAASPGSGLARRNGLRIGVAPGDLRARLRGSLASRTSTSREQMFITVRSGQEGMIQVGEDVFVTRLGYWTPLGYELIIERAFVGRAMAVRPRILEGGRVQVELWPVFTTRGPRGAIALTQLATTVTVGDGQSIVLGGLATGSEEVSAALFAIGRDTRRGTMTLVLTPKIGGMAIDWPKGKW